MSETLSSLAGVSGFPFSPVDMDLANEHFGAVCGHGALAAALGVPVLQVVTMLKRGWVNIPTMKEAIATARKIARKHETIPAKGNGVAMVQWLGSWMEPGVPVAARCTQRHWIGLHGGMIWDANHQHWMTPAEWEAWVPAIYPRRATGHELYGAWIWDAENADSNGGTTKPL